MNRPIPLPVAAAVLLATVGLVAWGAVRAAVRDSNPCPRALGRNYCYQCHTDARTLKAIKDKRGF